MSEPKITIHISLPLWMQEALDDTCKRLHGPCANRSAAVRAAVGKWLLEHGVKISPEQLRELGIESG